MFRGISAAVIVVALVLACAATAAAAPDPGIELEPVLNSQTPGVGNFEEVTDVASPPGEPQRLLIVQRPGLVDQQVAGQTSTFLDLRSVVSWEDNFEGFEKGLWSLAFPADYQTSHAFWAVFTVDRASGETGEPDIELAEFKTDSAGAVIAGSERVVVKIPHPTIHHYGGQITFGPEGDLYWSIGDGSVNVEASEFTKPQDLESPLGKILRIDPRQNGAEPFQIPPGNPFAGSANPFTRMIWAYGLRNPWRFSIDRASGTLAIGDVGNGEHEEVDLVDPEGGYRAGRGANFGWPCREGAHEPTYPVDATDGCPLTTPYVDPVFDYPHAPIEGSSHPGCAIMGGVIAGEGAPAAIDDRYLYADHCTGQVRSLDPTAADPGATDKLEIELPTQGPGHELSGEPNTFGTDSCGHVYVGTNIGFVYRIAGQGEAWACPHPEAAGAAEDPMGPEGPPVEGGGGEVPGGGEKTPGGGESGQAEGSTTTTPGGTGTGTTPPATAPSPSPAGPAGDKVRLSIAGHAGATYRLRAVLTPCEGSAPRTIVLRADGAVIGRRKLAGSCSTTFTVRAERAPRSFKASVTASASWAGALSAPLRIPARR